MGNRRAPIALLFIQFFLFSYAHSAKPQPAEQEALRSFVKIYKESKTHRDLIRKMPGFGLTSEKIHNAILGPEMDKPLPRMDFDFDKLSVKFDNLAVQFVDLKTGKLKVNGGEFTWIRGASYYHNWNRLQEKLLSAKSARIGNLLWPEAQAQNRDFFPPAPGEEVEGETSVPAKLMYAAEVGNLGYVGKLVGKGSSVAVKGALRVSAIASVAYVADFGVNFLHGTVVADSCEEQRKQLTEIMNQAKISLARFDCHWELGNRDNNISFFTPDGKLLPFIANWESSTLWVNESEIYKFGFSELKGVDTRTGESLSSGPKFEEYKKNLEAYRKVLSLMGRNNSCFGCARDFQKYLLNSKPGPYPVPGLSDSAAAAEAAQ